MELNFGKERHFRVPDGYFDAFQERIMKRVEEGYPAAQGKTPARRMRLIACAAACAAVIFVLLGTLLSSSGSAPQDREQQVLSSNTDDAELENSTIDQAVDYMMLDNDDLYAYIADE